MPMKKPARSGPCPICECEPCECDQENDDTLYKAKENVAVEEPKKKRKRKGSDQ